jgi:hypothetical protein
MVLRCSELSLRFIMVEGNKCAKNENGDTDWIRRYEPVGSYHRRGVGSLALGQDVCYDGRVLMVLQRRQ